MTSTLELFSRSWRTIFGVSIVCLSVTAFPHSGFSGEMITSYSADMVMISPDGTETGTSKLYITPKAYRMEGAPWGGAPGMSRDITILGRNDQNKQYIYNHEKKLVFESELDEQEMMNMMKSKQNVDSEKILGKEKVSGYTCTKKRVTTTSNMMGMKITNTQTICQSDRFEMPLWSQGEEGHITELRNINTDEPPAKLFQPLDGYQKVDNMMAIMGMDEMESRLRDDAP